MAASAIPTDDDLRGFLLGTVAAERVEAIRAWLEADPAHGARLEGILAGDVLTDALTNRAADTLLAVECLDRLTLSVSQALETLSPNLTQTRSASPDSAHADVAGAWPPVRLGQFLIVRELGHGGMGYVFEAEDEKLGRRVAVKVLTPELAHKPVAVTRFLHEARAAAAVEHENVVPILHVGEDAATPYIVMPLLRGESLQQRLKREGILSIAEVNRVGREVAAGLGAAHARGLIHRDLKPANIWLDADTGRARLLDFGLARLAEGGDALTAPGKLVGTPAYMAPEQIDGRADARSDLFSLGATLYECATGRRAFSASTVVGVLNAVTGQHPPAPADLNPEVPAGLSTLILRLLAKDPAGRPPDCPAVAAALAGEHGPGTATDRDRARPGTVPWRRWAWVAAAVAVVVPGIIGVWLATRSMDKPDKLDGNNTPPPAGSFRGKIDVLVERSGGGSTRLLRLSESGALPLRKSDRFRIEGEVDPPAYLYVLWIDPNHDITPVHPWDPTKGWNSRPEVERPLGKISLPANAGNRYTAPDAAPGVATMVLLARTTPLDVSDEQLNAWLVKLPDLPLPAGSEEAAVWFDDYLEVRDPLRRRTFGEVGSEDAFALWQGQLQQLVGKHADFQTAVSFARTGRK